MKVLGNAVGIIFLYMDIENNLSYDKDELLRTAF